MTANGSASDIPPQTDRRALVPGSGALGARWRSLWGGPAATSPTLFAATSPEARPDVQPRAVSRHAVSVAGQKPFRPPASSALSSGAAS